MSTRPSNERSGGWKSTDAQADASLDRWLARYRRFGSLLAVCWLMRHRPTGDCWLEPPKALWLPGLFIKKYNFFNTLCFLLAWHSRGRVFDSLQLHQEECQGVTEKSATPFSLAPCQLTAKAPVGSDSPGPGRLTHLPLPTLGTTS